MPWPDPEGYSERDKQWERYAQASIKSRNFWFNSARILAFILLFTITFLTSVFGQNKIVVTTSSDIMVIELFKDTTIDGHFFMLDQVGNVAEIWTTPTSWLITAPTYTDGPLLFTIPSLLEDNFEILFEPILKDTLW